MKYVNYFFLCLSIAGVIASVWMFIEASQPCGSDGCMIHILYFLAIPLFIISAIVWRVTYKSIERRKGQKPDKEKGTFTPW